MRSQIFGQDADILASRSGTTAWVLTSLEDCMEERQHHLNEIFSQTWKKSEVGDSAKTK
jgi:hypothetical protein